MEKEMDYASATNDEFLLQKEKKTLEAIESKFTAVVCYPHYQIPGSKLGECALY